MLSHFQAVFTRLPFVQIHLTSRQPCDKLASTSRSRAAGFNVPTVQFHNVLYERESDPQPTVRCRLWTNFLA